MLMPLRLRLEVFRRRLGGGKTALGAIISLSPIRSQQARVTAPAKFSRNDNCYCNQSAGRQHQQEFGCRIKKTNVKLGLESDECRETRRRSCLPRCFQVFGRNSLLCLVFRCGFNKLKQECQTNFHFGSYQNHGCSQGSVVPGCSEKNPITNCLILTNSHLYRQ